MEFNSFTRIHHEDTEIKVVKQMPTIASNKQPTIAIVTAQYCEKIAVDAMLENKETFVRYTTVGKQQLSQFCFLFYHLKYIQNDRLSSKFVKKIFPLGSSPEINMNDGITQTDKKNSKYRRFGKNAKGKLEKKFADM